MDGDGDGDAPCGMGMFVSPPPRAFPLPEIVGSLFVLHNCGKQPAGLDVFFFFIGHQSWTC